MNIECPKSPYASIDRSPLIFESVFGMNFCSFFFMCDAACTHVHKDEINQT